MKRCADDVRVNFMLAKDKHNNLLILSRVSGKSVTEILTDYISKIINENKNAIEERKELEAKLNESIKF